MTNRVLAKNAIINAKETGTLVLNKKSTPCIRALPALRAMQRKTSCR